MANACALLMLLLVGVGHAESNSAPEGFGKAAFGASMKTARAALPEMKSLPVPPNAGFLGNPKLGRFVLSQQKLEGLSAPVEVELRFWEDHLWTVIVYAGSNPFDAVLQMLEAKYGPPSNRDRSPTWVWPTRNLVTAPAQQWYSIADKEIGRAAQAALMESLHQAPPPAEPK